MRRPGTRKAASLPFGESAALPAPEPSRAARARPACPPRAMASSEIEHSSLELNLSRVDRIYRPGERVEGTLTIAVRHGWSHKGVQMRVAGSAKMGAPQRSLGVFESSGAVRNTVELVRIVKEITPPGRLPDGTFLLI